PTRATTSPSRSSSDPALTPTTAAPDSSESGAASLYADAMPEYAVPHTRKRGRPRGGESGARERILTSAVDVFAEHGYDGTTIRGIAARAGVDSALVHHYFGTKADLFAEAIGAPMRPDVDVP